MKKRYYLFGLLALTIFIIAYHFYAARQAEVQIDEAIREQTEKTASSTSITYSSIDVSPFDGDIRFDNLSIVDSSGILRSRSIRLDMDYRDFLNIYLWGLQYSLEHLTHARMNVDQPSFVDRSSFREIKSGSLNILFQGNAWDALISLVNSTPVETQQSLTIDGDTLTYHIPNSLPGTIKAETFNSEHSFPAKSTVWWQQGEHRMKLTRIIWTPPASFQEQYGFFIRGFDYETEQIPADSLRFLLDSPATGPALASADLFTELFDVRISSQILVNPDSFMNSRLKDGTVNINNTSEQFDIVTKNLEQLLGIKLSDPSGRVLRFAGPLNNPGFSAQQ